MLPDQGGPQGKEDRTVRYATTAALFVAGVCSWKIFISAPFSYWDFVPPPYGWGTSPTGRMEDLLGGSVWVRGSYWLWPIWTLFPALTAKALLIGPAILAPVAFLIFARASGISVAAAGTGALYYLLNPAVHARYLQGHVGALLGYALAPLFAKATLDTLRAPSSKLARHRMVVSLTLFLAASLQPHWAPLLVFTILPFAMALHWVAHRTLTRQSVAALSGAIMGALILSLPLVVIILGLGAEVGTRLRSTVHLEALSTNVGLLGAMRLSGEPAAGLAVQFGYASYDLHGLIGFAPVLVALSAPFVAAPVRRRPAIIALTALLVVDLLATGMTYLPAPYRWLYTHLPLFYAFRESSKFLLPAAFFTATAIAFSLDGLDRRLARQRSLTIAAGVALFIGAYTWPMLKGDLGILQSTIASPTRSDIELGRWIGRQLNIRRILLIPHDDVMFHVWPLVSRTPLFAVDHDRALSAPSGLYRAFRIPAIIFASQPERLAAELSNNGIRYVVVKQSDDTPAVNAGLNMTHRFTSRAATVPARLARQVVGGSVYFRKVATLSDYTIYENLNFRPWPLEPRNATDRPALSCLTDNLAPAQSERIIIADFGEWADPSEVTAAVASRWINGFAYEWVFAGPYSRGETTLANWYAITSGLARHRQSVVIVKPSIYAISLRWLSEDSAVAPAVVIDGRQFAPQAASAQGHFEESSYGTIFLGKGKHQVDIVSRGGLVVIDAVIIRLVQREGALAQTASHSFHGTDNLAQFRTLDSKYYMARRLLPGWYLLFLRQSQTGTIQLPEAAGSHWVTISKGVQSRQLRCSDGLLRIWTSGGTGAILVIDGFSAAHLIAWPIAVTVLVAHLVLLAAPLKMWRERQRRSSQRQASTDSLED